jgi:hypothetical protein
METTLVQRVEEMVHARKQLVLSTTPRTEAIAELAERLERLEQAVKEIASAVEKRPVLTREI